MKRPAAWLGGAVLLVGACAPGAVPGPAAPSPSPEVQWVQGPSPDVRSLVLPPAPVALLDEPEGDEMVLAVGAFLAETRAGGSARHNLALLLQLDGENPALALDLTRGLVVEMDGAVYVGDPGASGESFHVQASPLGRQVSVAVPVAVEDLEKLITARNVRLRLGGSDPFPFAPAARDRLRALVERLPVSATRRSQPFLAVQSSDR